MLLNALGSAPSLAEEVLGKSLYLNRAPTAAATFLYFVGIMGIVIFVFAALASMRVTEDKSRK